MLTNNIIQERVNKHQVIRNIDPCSLFQHDINNVIDIIIPECFQSIKSDKIKEHNYPWTSNGKLNNFHNLPKFDKVIQHITNNFHLPIEIRHVERINPSYKYYLTIPHDKNFDLIYMPIPTRFIESKYYYKIILHELAHAACDKARLNLQLTEQKEELTAELSALIVSFLTGYNVWYSCLSYVKNWYDTDLPIIDQINDSTKQIVKYFLLGINGL